jgi:hypothetical protein
VVQRLKEKRVRLRYSQAAPGTQAAIDVVMRLSKSAVSRIKNEKLDDVLTFLAHPDFMVVSSDLVCVVPSET